MLDREKFKKIGPYTDLFIINNYCAGKKPQEEVIVMTWHRQENTTGSARMERILRLVERLEDHVAYTCAQGSVWNNTV